MIEAATTLAQLAAADQRAKLDDLLTRWHQWGGQHSQTRGFAPKALVCGDYRTSRQWDDQNGALDDDIDDQIMRAVDFNVREMPEPHRSAIYCVARALTVGAAVFNHPRLPQDRAERMAVIEEARRRLTARLQTAGVM